MSTVGRVAITVGVGLLIGAWSYLSISDLDRNGELGSILFNPAFDWASLALLVLVPFLVNRWWAASIALAPLAVSWYLHEMTDYSYPFHEDPYPAITVMGTFFFFFLAVGGVALRRVACIVATRLG